MSPSPCLRWPTPEDTASRSPWSSAGSLPRSRSAHGSPWPGPAAEAVQTLVPVPVPVPVPDPDLALAPGPVPTAADGPGPWTPDLCTRGPHTGCRGPHSPAPMLKPALASRWLRCNNAQTSGPRSPPGCRRATPSRPRPQRGSRSTRPQSRLYPIPTRGCLP